MISIFKVQKNKQKGLNDYLLQHSDYKTNVLQSQGIYSYYLLKLERHFFLGCYSRPVGYFLIPLPTPGLSQSGFGVSRIFLGGNPSALGWGHTVPVSFRGGGDHMAFMLCENRASHPECG